VKAMILQPWLWIWLNFSGCNNDTGCISSADKEADPATGGFTHLSYLRS
jgi:hypothetical protein